MVYLKQYIFLFLLLGLCACGKNEFHLEFDLDKEISDNYNVTYYASDHHGDGATIQATASVREGKCELRGVTKYPTIIYITKRASVLPLVIYAKKGDKIIITGQDNNPLQWKVEGNKINNTLSEWRIQNSKIFEKCEADSVNRIVADFVEDNPDNPSSTLLLLSYFNRKEGEKEYSRLLDMLSGKAKKSEWLNLMGRSDQMDFMAPENPSRLKSLVMRSLKTGGDTLYSNNRDPILLIFWQTGYTEKKMLVDSVKALEKEFPDSVRIISDMCLDIDSVGWRNAVRRDSLYKDMKRFWNPQGVNNEVVRQLQVPSLPYFIVFNGKGYQEYRGTILSEAIKDYRELLYKTYPKLKKK